MKTQGIKRLVIAALGFGLLSSACEYTTIHEIQSAFPKPSEVISEETPDVPVAPSPSADSDDVIVPEAPPEGGDAGAAPAEPEAPRADEPPVGGGTPGLAPELGDGALEGVGPAPLTGGIEVPDLGGDIGGHIDPPRPDNDFAL